MNRYSSWSLASFFLKSVNKHHKKYVTPLEYMCVDETLLRRYGLGRSWLDVELPYYVVLDWKSKKCCESKILTYTGIEMMLWLESAGGSTVSQCRASENESSVTTAVTLNWSGSGCEQTELYLANLDLYPRHLHKPLFMRSGMRPSGVVETATREYPVDLCRRKILPT